MPIGETVKETVKLVTASFPWPIQKAMYRSWRNRGMAGRLQNRLAAESHERVRRGPFAGMEIETAYYGPTGICRVIGAYECELDSWVRQVVVLQPKRIVVVGAADGHYATGFARLLPEVRVVAFEENSAARKVGRTLMRRNGVKNRIRMRGRCEPEDLEQAILPGAVVLCDVEGYETTLLDPSLVPTLRACAILAELHDIGNDTAIFETINRRFLTTHQLRVIPAIPRNRAEWPELDELPTTMAEWLLSEARQFPKVGPQTAKHRWIWLEPRQLAHHHAASNGATAS